MSNERRGRFSTATRTLSVAEQRDDESLGLLLGLLDLLLLVTESNEIGNGTIDGEGHWYSFR
jgi:hypothetical protein